ncbi:MAG TPA: pyridoxamine 5'-phosphate oxidase family protein [Solirubrobacteraceae bacterium]|jgi:nitroimidazol reductase NimA-like FMN-containing flavoprotein (pyridoxamine 5'-phosphate oxidase superfamily)|nr:pyridoxamine 5'-phosphate oxidase family protein [Solirubrobacteraceae bacterium]
MTETGANDLKAELEAGEEILRTATLARIAYDGIDGTPRVIPIGFLWTGDAVVVATHPSSPKFAALRARPRVALTIDTPSPPRSLLLRGDAEIEVVDGVAPEYLEAAAKSMEGEELAAFERSVRETYDVMARITIVPDWARYFDFSAGRLPGFLRELTSKD